MKTHPLHPQVAMPEHLSQLRIINYESNLCLTDEHDLYIGAVFKSKELDAIANSFNYNASGYNALLSGCDAGARVALAQCKDYSLQTMRQGIPKGKDHDMVVSELDPDLIKYQGNWKNLFNSFVWEAAALAGNNFEVRLTCLQFDKEGFHCDQDIVGVLPCGKNRPGTLFKGLKGEIIRSGNNELVVSTPQLEHSWPVFNDQRACLAFLANLDLS